MLCTFWFLIKNVQYTVSNTITLKLEAMYETFQKQLLCKARNIQDNILSKNI